MVARASEALCTSIALARSIPVSTSPLTTTSVSPSRYFSAFLMPPAVPRALILDGVIYGETNEILLVAEVGLDRVRQVTQREHRAIEARAAQKVQHVPHKGTVAERHQRLRNVVGYRPQPGPLSANEYDSLHGPSLHQARISDQYEAGDHVERCSVPHARPEAPTSAERGMMSRPNRVVRTAST